MAPVVGAVQNAGGEVWHEPAPGDESAKQLVRAQLSRLLEDTHLRSSRRCSRFLQYIVEHALENRLEPLKERDLGIAVFERRPDYDTNDDPVVRNAASETRKRLAQYYLEPTHEHEIRIALPTGSYVPEIRFPSVKLQDEPPVSRPAKARRARWWLPAAGVALLALAVYGALTLQRTDLERFWDPVATSSGPVLVCVGQPRVFGFRAGRQYQLQTWFENSTADQTPPPEMANLPFMDIAPLWDRYIDIVDAQAYDSIARFFSARGKMVQLRGDRSVSLSELRGRPVVLIGAFSNDWTLSLAGELRFRFQNDFPHQAQMVADSQNPQKTDWSVVGGWPSWKIPADYAIVTRVRNPTTEKTMVIAGGITHFGTRAAAEMLTDEAYFHQALRGAPKDWYRKNMQVVISVRVISGAGGPPQVVANHFW